MDLEHQRRVTELASQAFDMQQAHRKDWLEQACARNPEQLADVWALLKVMESDGTYSRLDALNPKRHAVTMDDSDWLGKSIGGYRILEKLGEGGMGWVFLAHQKQPIERKVALKIIKPVSRKGWEKARLQTVFPQAMELQIRRASTNVSEDGNLDHEAVTECIQAEPQMLAKFTHPYIAQVYEAGKTGEGFVYFAMEYIQGKPLTEYCRSQGLAIDERLFLFMKVCRGVQHAHQNAVLHLDLKPSNILVSDIDGTASPKVIDFGIARMTGPLGDGLHGNKPAMGTPVYMCPEAFLGQNDSSLDSRADVYALGVILFELLTEKPAQTFQEKSNDSKPRSPGPDAGPDPISGNHNRGGSGQTATWSPRQLEPKLKLELNSIILKATAEDREHRYSSPADLAADLKRFISGKPVVAVTPTPFYMARKFISRHKLAATGSTLFLLAMILGLGFAWSSYHRATHALKFSRDNVHFMTAVIEHTSWPPNNRHLDRFLNDAEHMVNHRFGKPSPSRAYYLMLLADIHARNGQLDRAEPLIQESVAIMELGPPDSSDLIPNLLVRGRLFLASERFDEAEIDFSRALSIMKHRLDNKKLDHPLYYLARVYDAQERYEDVEAICRQSQTITTGKGDSRHLRDLIRLLVKSLRKQGRESEAKAYEKRLGKDPRPRRPRPRHPSPVLQN